MAKERLAREWQQGEVDPFDLKVPYEPVAEPVRVPRPSQSLTPRTATHLTPLSNQLYEGDALATLQQWEDKTFHACITDPPYNIARDRKGLSWAFSSHVTIDSDWDRFSQEDYEQFTTAWLKEVCRTVKENGNIVIFGSYHNIYTIGAIAARLDLRVINSIIWAKPNAQPNITCRMLTESTEQVLWICNNTNKKAKNWTFNYD
ncbi:MAG: site-specific DNA-methyltransferase, partial [Deltaproteobacteria bacterium]|nr:site-specific DNA-methyltransferase [Deltaproteobacteria bacterium]